MLQKGPTPMCIARNMSGSSAAPEHAGAEPSLSAPLSTYEAICWFCKRLDMVLKRQRVMSPAGQQQQHPAGTTPDWHLIMPWRLQQPGRRPGPAGGTRAPPPACWPPAAAVGR